MNCHLIYVKIRSQTRSKRQKMLSLKQKKICCATVYYGIMIAGGVSTLIAGPVVGLIVTGVGMAVYGLIFKVPEMIENSRKTQAKTRAEKDAMQNNPLTLTTYLSKKYRDKRKQSQQEPVSTSLLERLGYC